MTKLSKSFAVTADDKDPDWKENREDEQKKCQRKAKWTTAKEQGGMMGDHGDRELYEHEGGKGGK